MRPTADQKPSSVPDVDALTGVRMLSVVTCRYIFQHTQSSRMPPASVSPMMASSCTVIAAKKMRSTTAAAMPQKITLVRISGATRDAARPTMMALSPASTRSIIDDVQKRDEVLAVPLEAQEVAGFAREDAQHRAQVLQ